MTPGRLASGSFRSQIVLHQFVSTPGPFGIESFRPRVVSVSAPDHFDTRSCIVSPLGRFGHGSFQPRIVLALIFLPILACLHIILEGTGGRLGYFSKKKIKSPCVIYMYLSSGNLF